MFVCYLLTKILYTRSVVKFFSSFAHISRKRHYFQVKLSQVKKQNFLKLAKRNYLVWSNSLDQSVNSKPKYFYGQLCKLNTCFHLPDIHSAVRTTHYHKVIKRTPSYALQIYHTFIFPFKFTVYKTHSK